MDFFGVGPLELFFILIIALIVLGPQDMVKAGRTLGRLLRKVVTSPTWRVVQQTSRDIRFLPNRLMREAGLDEIKDQLPQASRLRQDMGLDKAEKDIREWQKDVADWTTPPTIAPPAVPPIPTGPDPTPDPDPESENQ